MKVEEILEVLRGLGLTEYQAKAYIALVSFGSATPSEVAGRADMPHPSVYRALETLAKKSWVEVALGRPRRYRARAPELIEKSSIKKVKGAFVELKKIYERSKNRLEKPEIIYTITGQARVLKKIQEMLSRAEKGVILVLPSYREIAPRIDRLLGTLVLKGVKVRLITESAEDFPQGIMVGFRKPVLAVDILVDGKESMISTSDYSVCGWVENPVIAKHFKEFLELLWGSSKASVG